MSLGGTTLGSYVRNITLRSRLGDERPSMFADMIVIVEGIVTVVEQRYALYSW